MIDLRYGGNSRVVSGLVMWGYTFVLTVPSTLAFSTVFTGLFDMHRTAAIVLGGGIVVLYSTLGGMWSVTMTDIAQFVIKTVGLLLILTPVAIWHAGGFTGMSEQLNAPTSTRPASGSARSGPTSSSTRSACSSGRTSGSGSSPAEVGGSSPQAGSAPASTAWSTVSPVRSSVRRGR